MGRHERANIISKLFQMSEEAFAGFLNEATSSARLRHGLGRAGEKILANKQAFDRNIEAILEFVNLPSRKDFRELRARVDHLASQLLNLNLKLDRALARAELKAKPSKAGGRPSGQRPS